MTEGRSVARMVRDLASRLDVAARLIASAGSAPAHGADLLATVAAYRLAATAADGEAAHATKVAALGAFIVATEPTHRRFRATLIDSTLAAEADARLARGAPLLGRRLRGWMRELPIDRPTANRAAAVSDPHPPQTVVEACAEAAGLDDVDVVLLRTLAITRAMRAAAARGEGRDALLDAYEGAALSLCVRPSSPVAVDDPRWLLLHQWTLLRRHRPLGAATVRAAVLWRRRGGPRDDLRA